jgi:transcriptional regulator GlxA family with amidase domain
MRGLATLLVAVLLTSCFPDSLVSQDQRPLSRPSIVLNVGVVAVDGVRDTELAAPLAVLGGTGELAPPGMRLFVVARSREPVVTLDGMSVLPDFSFEEAPPIDVLVVPGAQHSTGVDLLDDELIAFVRARGLRARYRVGLGEGVYVLARAGLLDDRDCTTVPAGIQRLRALSHERGITVHEGVSFAHDGPVVTSVGGVKSYEALLYLCDILYGRDAAEQLAARLVLWWDREAIEHHFTPRWEEGARAESLGD